jgi:hypothetical protein
MRPPRPAGGKAGLVADLERQGHEGTGQWPQLLGGRGTGRLGLAAASRVVMGLSSATSAA